MPRSPKSPRQSSSGSSSTMPPYASGSLAARREDEEEGGSFDNLDLKLGQLGDLAMEGEKKGKNKLAPLARGTACSVCRKRKLRCNGARPACASCARLGHDCVYGDRIQEELQERNRELEDEISSLRRELAQHRGDSPVNTSDISSQLKRPAAAVGFASFTVPHQTDAIPAPRLPHPSGSRSINIQHETPRMPFYNIPQHPSYAHTIQVPTPYQGFPAAAGRTNAGPPNYLSPHNRFSSPIDHLSPYPQQPPSIHRSILHEHTSAIRMEDPLPPTPPGSGPGFGSVDETDSNRLSAMGGLPDADLLNSLTNLYFMTSHIHLPFLHRSRFLYFIKNPASFASAPSLSLVLAILAISAPYHDDPNVRARGARWYTQSKEMLDGAISTGLSAEGGKESLTVEMVQSLLLLAMVEMGGGHHQKAFLSIGQASRIVTMLGLHKMDEDRLHDLEGGATTGRRLRPPALHHLPSDPLSLEECRRTMCAVFVLDRYESGCVGWPMSLSESSLRLLLPCEESLFQDGTCQASDNPLWWPSAMSVEEEDKAMGPVVDGFAWLCRTIWLGGRVQEQSYRPSGRPPVGPFQVDNLVTPMDETNEVIEMDRQLMSINALLNRRYGLGSHEGVDSPGVMSLVVLNCLFLNVHHLRVALLSSLPFDPEGPIVEGSPEWSMARCLEGTRSIHDIVARLCAMENYSTSTSTVKPRVTPLTTFVPYLLYCIAFAARFAIGDWTLLGKCQARVENLSGTLSASHPSPPDASNASSASSGPSMPSGDDVFGEGMDRERLEMIEAMCAGLDRMGCIWETGNKFVKLVRMDRDKLMARSLDRHNHSASRPSASLLMPMPHPHPYSYGPGGGGGGGSGGHLLDRSRGLQGDRVPSPSHLASPGY